MAFDRRMIALAAVAAVAPFLMAAQTTPAPDGEEIVVTGERLTPAQARERAVAYVQHTGIVAGKEAVARWVDKVCPRAVGLSAEHARVVEARVRAIAASVGAATAPEKCVANVMINFVGDGAAFTSRVATSDPRRVAEVPAARRVALLTGTEPIRWWYRTEVRGRHGARMVDMVPSFVSVDGQNAGPAFPTADDTGTIMQYSSSNLSTQVNRALVHATVVVDTTRATGRTLDAVAAYTAFVALAEIIPRDEPLQGSILGLFGDESVHSSLSKLDTTFLRELYKLALDRKARQQRTRLVRALQNEQSTF